MGDEYEDLIELGLEGVDRFATHFHDRAAAFVGHHYHAHSPWRSGGHGRNQNTDHRQEEKPEKERTRELSPSERESASPRPPEPHLLYPGGQLPPPEEHLNRNSRYHPHQRSGEQRIPSQQPRTEEFLPKASATSRDQAYPPSYSIAPNQARERRRFDQDDYHNDRDAERSDRGDFDHRRTHRGSGRGKRQREWRDDDGYDRDVEEGTYYGYAPDRGRVQTNERELSIGRGDNGRRENGAYIRTIEEKASYGARADRSALSLQGMDREKFAPPGYGYTEKSWAVAERPRGERRRSSWSPPRRRSGEREWEEAQRQRPCSKSPNHYRMVATFVGAVAGGVAGNRLKKGEAGPSPVATLAGVVVGGIGAREVEKLYDGYRERRREEGRGRGR